MEKKTSFIDEREELMYRQMEQKEFLEIERHKQDCRKRALDLAHSEVFNPNKATSLAIGGVNEKDVLDAADKYYNWLISIPN